MKKYLTNTISLIVLIGLVFVLPIVIEFGKWLYLFRSCLILLLFVEIIRLMKKIFYDENIPKTKSYVLFGAPLLCLLLVIEFTFMFIPYSHGVRYTYGARIWSEIYWSKNSNGFRDKEPSNITSTILFVGDSFTAGHGIKDINDRFSNLLSQQLKSYGCINIGRNGADTDAEFKTMVNFLDDTNIIPKFIVLQYFGNDIKRMAQKSGLLFKRNKPYDDLNYFGEILVRGSFLINYLYWLFPHSDATPYLDFFTRAYSDSTIFNNQLNSIDKFVNYSEENDIELIVVVFPIMTHLKLSQSIYVDKVLAHLKKRGISTINVSRYLGNLNPRDLVVNKNDGHCSVKVHKIVANKLKDIIEKNEKWLQQGD